MLLCVSVQAQADLERKIERIFLYQPASEEKYDRKAKIEQLEAGNEAHSILLRMLSKYKNSEPESREFLFLVGAVSVLGEMKEGQATEALSQMLFDKKVHENARALSARALGQISPEENKSILLKALADKGDYFAIRVNAAEALGKTRDAEILRVLEKYSNEEADSHVKQKFEKAAQELKGRLRRP
jgi:HEAT repeat protein